MARTTTLHLKVDTDSTPAVELAPRVKAAILDGLGAALAEGGKQLLDWDALAAAATRSVMAEILRVRQATPAENAHARADQLAGVLREVLAMFEPRTGLDRVTIVGWRADRGRVDTATFERWQATLDQPKGT